MGNIIRANVDASNAAPKVWTGVTRGLLGKFFFDTSVDKATRDFSTASNAMLTAVGSPVVAADGVTFTAGTNFVETNLAEPDDFSFAMVVRYLNGPTGLGTPEDRGIAAGNLMSGESPATGMALGFQGVNAQDQGYIAFNRYGVAAANGGISNKNCVFTGITDHTTWRLFTGVCDTAAGTFTVRSETDNLQASASFADLSGFSKSLRTLRIGSRYDTSSQAGSVQLSQFQIHDVALTSAELATIIAEIRDYEAIHNGRTV